MFCWTNPRHERGLSKAALCTTREMENGLGGGRLRERLKVGWAGTGGHSGGEPGEQWMVK